ncbi:response regulator [Flavobacterium sp.]|uniref:response regulator n=1 Tax=Flavobacterium sp. TaxID=239 RepID=UPI0037B5D214
MADNNLNRNLKRQINKFLSDELINDNPSIQEFIEAVNQSFQNYEKDAELFEQSIRLNDLEFYEINTKIQDQLEKKKRIQAELIQAIKLLNGKDGAIELGPEDNLTELLQILHNEIEYKRESEEQLSISIFNAEKANEAKSDFLSIMSHEIRTPLNAIIGLIYIMEKERTVESLNENFDVLKTSAQNLFLLLNNILDFNKIEAGKIDLEIIPFNFKDLVLEIVRSLQAKAIENQNKIEVIIDDNFAGNIISDPLRISQIITNLVLNAIKFTKNGLIQVRINQINEIGNHSVFKVHIQDNGIGINLEKFNSIFQKFTQADTKTSRQYGGSGLGLVITKNLLNLFHSEIELESEIGVGSKFSFVLNLPIFNKNSELENGPNTIDYKEQKLEGLKVLLVEDNLINVKIAEKILKQWDVSVDVALNGLIAVEKHKANVYDIILMDLSMPVMDGYDATINIRSTDSTIPIIALTASTSYLSLEKAMQIGINEYITKPFSPRELNLKLSKHYYF